MHTWVNIATQHTKRKLDCKKWSNHNDSIVCVWLQWRQRPAGVSLSHTHCSTPTLTIRSAPPQITAECSFKPLQALQILRSNPLTENAQTSSSPVWPCGYWLTISLLTPLSLSPLATSSERGGGLWDGFVWCANSELQEGNDDMKTSLQRLVNVLIYDVREA